MVEKRPFRRDSGIWEGEDSRKDGGAGSGGSLGTNPNPLGEKPTQNPDSWKLGKFGIAGAGERFFGMNPGCSLGIQTPNPPGREGKTRMRNPDPVGSRTSSQTSPALPRSSSPRWMSRARRSRRAGGCRTRSSLRPFPIPRIPAPPRRSRDPCPAASTFPRGWRLFRAAIPGISPPSRGSSAGRFPPGSRRSRTPSVEGGWAVTQRGSPGGSSAFPWEFPVFFPPLPEQERRRRGGDG